MASPRIRPLYGVVIVLGILACQSVVGAQGFGLRKRKIVLQVRQPALVRLADTSLAFKSSVTSPEYAPPVQTLEAVLETELMGNEKTLVKKSESEAQWVL